MLVGLCKQFIKNFVFPTWACAAGFNNNNKKGFFVAISRPGENLLPQNLGSIINYLQ